MALALPLRTPKTEYTQTMMNWIHDASAWRERGWTEPGLFRWPSALPDPTPLRAARLALEGFTIGGAPCIDRGIAYWLALRGFDTVETWLFAFDARDGAERWRAHLGTISRPWQSERDLGGLFPEGRIVPRRDELLVVHGGGWVARVGRATGDLRGALLYPRIRRPTVTLPKWGRHTFNRLPAPRPRYLGDAWVHERDGAAPIFICLPPDSRQVLAIDLDEWRLAWTPAPPASEQTLLLRDPAGIPWCIDLRTAPGKGEIQALSLHPDTGRLREPGEVLLQVARTEERSRRARVAEADAADFAPVIAGVPSLAGPWIAVPIASGWALWPREPLTGGPPARLIPWPDGSRGGTVVPAGAGRWLVISRAEPAWEGSRSLAEVMEEVRE
jgi:hypothetical protein